MIKQKLFLQKENCVINKNIMLLLRINYFNKLINKNEK